MYRVRAHVSVQLAPPANCQRVTGCSTLPLIHVAIIIQRTISRSNPRESRVPRWHRWLYIPHAPSSLLRGSSRQLDDSRELRFPCLPFMPYNDDGCGSATLMSLPPITQAAHAVRRCKAARLHLSNRLHGWCTMQCARRKTNNRLHNAYINRLIARFSELPLETHASNFYVRNYRHLTFINRRDYSVNVKQHVSSE